MSVPLTEVSSQPGYDSGPADHQDLEEDGCHIDLQGHVNAAMDMSESSDIPISHIEEAEIAIEAGNGEARPRAIPPRLTYKSVSKSSLLGCFKAAEDEETVKPPSPNRSGMTSRVESQLINLSRKFRMRTASFKKEALSPPSPDDSDAEEEQISKVRSLDALKAPEPHTYNQELRDAVEQNANMSMNRCCTPIKCSTTIAPQSHWYLLWLSLVTLAYIYNIVSIMLRTAFQIYYTTHNVHVWLCLDYTCDLIYLMDLLVVKPRLQFIKSGLLQTDAVSARRNYLRSSDFKLDLLSLIPLDFFYLLTGVFGRAPLLRLPRYLKLKTAWEFFDRCDQAAKSGYVIRVMRTMTYMLFLIHVETCGYYAISAYEGIGSNHWVYNGQGNAYIRCFYLATKTATSIGNNPKPTNQLEYMFMVVYWLSGVFVFALLIGQIRDIFESANSVKSNYQKAQDSTLQYLQNLNVPIHVQEKVRDWFNYNWEQQKTLNENLLVDVLPTKMKTDLFISVHYETLSKVSLFQDCDKTLLSDLILKLVPVIFLPGDYICRKGEVGTEMYIIMHGEVEVVTEEGATLATLSKGKVFGEISLLGISGGNRRTANVRSKGYANLFILSKYDFERAMQDYPAAYALLKKRAQKLLKRTPNDSKAKKTYKDAVNIISNAKPLKTPKLISATLQLASKKGNRISEWLSSSKYKNSPSIEAENNLPGTPVIQNKVNHEDTPKKRQSSVTELLHRLRHPIQSHHRSMSSDSIDVQSGSTNISMVVMNSQVPSAGEIIKNDIEPVMQVSNLSSDVISDNLRSDSSNTAVKDHEATSSLESGIHSDQQHRHSSSSTKSPSNLSQASTLPPIEVPDESSR